MINVTEANGIFGELPQLTAGIARYTLTAAKAMQAKRNVSVIVLLISNPPYSCSDISMIGNIFAKMI